MSASLIEEWAPDGTEIREKPVTYYRGKGTMLRYSGAYSNIDCSPAVEILQSHMGSWDNLTMVQQQSKIDDVVAVLQATSEVQQLWADFKRFVAELVAKNGIQRHTVGMELNNEEF